MPEVDGFWGVVPAGGAGTRLWPLSRAARPKFLLDLTGSGRTLLQGTVDRLTPLTGDRVVVVTGASHAEAVAEQLPQLGADRVLAEPAPRDSMAAIGLAAAVVERADPGAVIGSFAADHVIPDAETFRTAVREAVEVARDGHLVTLGVEPTHPATGFGYIRAGDALTGFPTARRAREFVEKPDVERATAYLASREYLWNAGMFVVRAGALLDLLAQWHPELAAGVRAIAADPERLDDIWPGLEKIAIDHAVAEPAAAAGRVVVVPAPFGWDDVGDFASLSTLLPAAEGPMTVVGDPADVTAVDAEGLVVAAGGRRVAVVGLDDVVVVDTPDAVLVTTRARAQDVKQVVDALKASGRSDLT
ncbi:mannose-1-phosphate guanylyltransferase [Phycicoccus duodecadis]|uniref:Mannose-1-phosphate guanylyltransferase n=1 Tax=Phycicoccus duodecadis TaxID=173053 RepID=A0A2N3YKC1_9MICO|nr:mannose-1-phosphate guanylyltransferase [Phycicoccus duodecadis]PKW27303.1 mannose-1-phosphate guanylyltransferase [Phycicoccus duodecadis]